MSDIQLIVTDVDGTLVASRGNEPSKRLAATIERIQASGKHVVIASARPAKMAESVVSHLGLHGLQVIDGGASVYDFDKNELVWSQWLDIDRLRDIVRSVVDDVLVIDCFPEFRMLPIEDFDLAYVVEPAPYVYAKIPSDARESIWRRLDVIPDIAYHVVDREAGYDHIQINDSQATKQHGVQELQAILGVTSAQTLAIGDMDNDLALFAVADTRVAMHDATDTLKANATYITGTVENEGWVSAMEHFGI